MLGRTRVCALGLLRPSGGSGTVLGRPLGDVAVRERIGFLPENPYFYDHLSARELLDMCASISGVPRRGRKDRITTMLERVGLTPGEKRVLRKFSKGMLQRVGLAQALLHEPDLVILDEPCGGTDHHEGQRQSRIILNAFHLLGAATFFTTHMHEMASAMSADQWPGVQLLQVLTEVDGDQLSYLYQIVPGIAQRSHGEQIAAQLGLGEQEVLQVVRAQAAERGYQRLLRE